MKQDITVCDYFPLQPALQFQSSDYMEKKEFTNNIVSSLVYYQFQLGDHFEIIPDGCVDILFPLHADRPVAMVCGSPLARRAFPLEVGQKYFGVKFFPSSPLMKEALDESIPITDLFSIDPGTAEQIAAQPGFHERIGLFKHLLCTIIPNTQGGSDVFQYALNRIYSMKGNIPMEQLSAETGVSARYLRKTFKENTGFSPKAFSQINRFQHALYMLSDDHNHSVWDVIAENGYHDQAHLIHEFKKFGYVTPNTFVGYVHQQQKAATGRRGAIRPVSAI